MSGEHTITVERLLERADAGDPFLLLDVRNGDEFEAWKVEARRPIEIVHIPYFDFVEDPDLVARVPSDRGDVLVVCAKGGSSEFVADLLRESGVPATNVEGGMVAYGAFLQPVRVPLEPDEAERLELWQLHRRGKGCLSYVVRSGDAAVVVDPSRDVEAYRQFVEGLGARIAWVLDTHVHADHVSGGPELARLTGARYWVGTGDDLERAGADVRVLRTPGHTPDSSSFLVGRSHLLTGDTIFVSSIGRPDLGGHVVEWSEQLFDTLHERLADVPDDVVILPAHCSGVAEMRGDGVVAARLGEVRRTVPEMRIGSRDAFVDAMRAALSTPPESYARIIAANRDGDAVDPDEATEWELGKNRCAAGGH